MHGISSKIFKARFLLGLIVLALLILGLLELTNTTHFLHKGDLEKKIVHAGNNTPTPSNNASDGSAPAKKTLNHNNSSLDGGAIDTRGQANAKTPSSKWIISASGNITVKQPVANSKISSGSVLSGTAKVNKVGWRLIDNQTGVIGQGTLDVVSGTFSGILKFSAASKNGRLDVFSTNSSGVELNEIQVSVGF